MIITKDEFVEMGFRLDNKSTPLFDGCEKRAEYVLNGITNGRAGIVAKMGGTAAELVKEAMGFQTDEIIKEELAYSKSQEDASKSSNAQKSEQRVSIGDFSYTTGTSNSSSESSSSKSSEATAVEPLNIGKTIIRLLRAAGCLYGGVEVVE